MRVGRKDNNLLKYTRLYEKKAAEQLQQEEAEQEERERDPNVV